MSSHISRILKTVLAFCMIALIAGCNGGSATQGTGQTITDQATGAIVARLDWDTASKSAVKSASSALAGVATVRIIITGSDISQAIQQDFTVASGSGTIDGIPVGTGRTLTAQGVSAAGSVTYQGAATNITVLAGQTTDAGTITMSLVQSSSVTYPVVDTGQTKTYNASSEISAPASGQSFYGQDAQFFGTQPSYIVSSDGKTVYDNNTRLTWMRGPNTTLTTPVSSDKKTYSQALAWVATVNTMNYGGFSDWRMPTIKELYSLMNFSGTDPSGYTGSDTSSLTPFINTAYFTFGYGQLSAGERIIDSQYASSTMYLVKSFAGYNQLFGLNLADGRIKGYDLTMPDGRTEKTFFVQLVRGSAGYGINSFTSNSDGTVTDAATGLIWSKADSGSAMSWQTALAWVQEKNATNYLGYSDWRLPNAKELHSLVNYANAPDYNGKPAIDTAFFDTTVITNENGDSDYPYYWTSTTHATYNGMGASAVYIPFGRALGYSTSTGWYDVHGAGCQRSDPKTGPPFAWASVYTVTKNGKTYTGYSFGPQGDALRGLNFVRPVRTASSSTASSFALSSSVALEVGSLPADYTCDGSGASPPLTWSNAPAGTKEFALLMTTLPGDGTIKWNWVLYGIPVTATGLSRNSTGVGTTGTGSHGTTMMYDPPCSQGPGDKVYTFTLYALSGSPVLPASADQVTGVMLTQAIASLTLGTATLNLKYART